VIWSPQQQRALSAVAAWLRDPDGQQVFRLFGYAGTGKTTLVKHIAEGVVGKVLFAAFTGKAAHVMREKGCPDASTIHRLIYRLVSEEDGRPRFELDPASELRDARLLIVDEASMVDETIGRDLLSFGTPILVVADPWQLPPIQGCGFLTTGDPDVMLSEIHRQALNDPIIHMSMTVRTGGRLALGTYGASRVIAGGDIDYLAADQVLVGRNATRRGSNAMQRSQRGLSGPYPQALTVHKAQGSQWDDVVLIDESRCFREDRARCTRASQCITVVTR
jgi:exodeoxyribonuclease-5